MREPPHLKSLVVFNPTLGLREGEEEEKILFYFPAGVPLGERNNHVGMSEALINFTSKFNPKEPVETLVCEKHKEAFYSPEPNVWFALSVTAPVERREGKGGEKELVYDSQGGVPGEVLQTILRRCYHTFRLFNGSFAHVIKTFSLRTLKDKLEEVLPSWLASLEIEIAEIASDVMFDGMHFMPLDKNLFLRVASFVNIIENVFPMVRRSCFLYDNHLVWSGLRRADVHPLYHWVTQHRRKMTGGRRGFVTGPEDMSDVDTPVVAPKVMVGKDCEEEYRLIVYEMNKVTLLLMIEPASLHNLSFYRELEAFAAPHIRSLTGGIRQLSARVQMMSEEYKYVYFNGMNLALKMTVRSTKAGGGGGEDDKLPTVSDELWRLIGDLHSRFGRGPENAEVLLKTSGSGWLVARRSGEREFFVAFNHKNANMMEISEAQQRLEQEHFQGIFL